MARKDLPPRFLRFRSKYIDRIPPVVVYFTAEEYDHLFDRMKEYSRSIKGSVTSGAEIKINYYSCFWFETKNWAFLATADEVAAKIGKPVYHLSIADKNGDCVANCVVDAIRAEENKPTYSNTPKISEKDVEIGISVFQHAFFMLSMFFLSPLDHEIVNTEMRRWKKNSSGALFLEKKGDTVTYQRLSDLRRGTYSANDPYTPPEPGASGIKMREHEVRGYWRSYPSGKRVWVRPHMRGDPDIGKVTRIVKP